MIGKTVKICTGQFNGKMGIVEKEHNDLLVIHIKEVGIHTLIPKDYVQVMEN